MRVLSGIVTLSGNLMSCWLFHYSGNNWFCVGKKYLRPSACWDKRCHSWSTLGVSKFGPTNRSVHVTCYFNVTLLSVTNIQLRFSQSWASTQQPVVLFFFLDRILALVLSGFLKTCLLKINASHQKKAKTRSCWSAKIEIRQINNICKIRIKFWCQW